MLKPIPLRGCTPTPLASYLKGLGILRLIVEPNSDRKAQDAQAKGYWQNDAFVLLTHLSQEELEHFFLYDYEPSPLVAPWNGSTGFYPKDNQKTTLGPLRNSSAARLAVYRATVEIAQQQVTALKLTVQPKDKEEKRRLLERLRNHLPDAAVKWLDTCALVTAKEVKFPPLTGTGGNDGNFEFSRTFLQQLQNLIDFATGQPTPGALPLLKAALFNETLPGLPFSGKIGQFNPIAAGGANAAPGYDADSRVNPWDFVLMLEGILLFTAGVTRRYEQSDQGGFAYPFTVRPSNVGYGSASEGDEARAELWTPLWSTPVGLRELQVLFSEGRAKVGDRTARDGVDFYRAVSSLGRDRGVDEFVRYSFQVRNGLSYFAVPLDRFQPQFNPQVDRLAPLDRWLESFKRAAQDANAPAAIKRAQRRLETAIVDLSRTKGTLLEVLIALGEAEATLNRSLRFVQEKFLRPVPFLDARWSKDCDDGSPEFRLALALAGNRLRQRLVQVRQVGNYPEWATHDDGITTWQQGDLVSNLVAWLLREEVESQQREKAQVAEDSEVTQSASIQPFASLDDIVRWITDAVDQERLEAIARGLSLVKLAPPFPRSQAQPLPVPVAYALVKLTHARQLKREACRQAFASNRDQSAYWGSRQLKREEYQRVLEHHIFAQDLTLPRVPALVAKLAAGDCMAATSLAIRRLSASGLNPAVTNAVYESSDRTRRIAAALAFPISDFALARLLKQIRQLEPKE